MVAPPFFASGSCWVPIGIVGASDSDCPGSASVSGTSPSPVLGFLVSGSSAGGSWVSSVVFLLFFFFFFFLVSLSALVWTALDAGLLDLDSSRAPMYSPHHSSKDWDLPVFLEQDAWVSPFWTGSSATFFFLSFLDVGSATFFFFVLDLGSGTSVDSSTFFFFVLDLGCGTSSDSSTFFFFVLDLGSGTSVDSSTFFFFVLDLGCGTS